MKITLILLALSFAAILPGQTTGDRQARILKLEDSLLAPCCWAEPVSKHRSEISLQMRDEITGFVNQGKTDDEVLDYYKQKYGLRILVEPQGAAWWWMHVVPVVILGLGAILVIVVLKRWMKPLPASLPS